MDAVFSAPELLEAIISSLSMQDILVNATRVNRAWNATINESPALQQHLFFDPQKTSPYCNPAHVKNPLLIKKFPGWFLDLRATGQFYIDPDSQEAFMEDYLGPFKSYRFTGAYNVRNSEWAARSDAFSRANASWRRMLVIQPPVTQLNIVYASQFRKRWVRKRETKEFHAGSELRMGFLYDFAIDELDETLVAFTFLWNMFEVEDDADAREFHGEEDPIYCYKLIEKADVPDSLTMIFRSCHENSNGWQPRKFGHNKLEPKFRSRVEDVIQSDGVPAEGIQF